MYCELINAHFPEALFLLSQFSIQKLRTGFFLSHQRQHCKPISKISSHGHQIVVFRKPVSSAALVTVPLWPLETAGPFTRPSIKPVKLFSQC